jgi:transcriptional regulator of acetoin/glycerol metabolism
MSKHEERLKIIKTLEQEDAAGKGKKTIRQAEIHAILKALKKNKGILSKTAVELGIGRNTLWRKIKQIQGEL